MFFHMVYKSGQIFLPFCHNSRVWQTDGQTDRQTVFSSLDRACIPCSAVKTDQWSGHMSGLSEAAKKLSP